MGRTIKQCIDELMSKLEKADKYTKQHSIEVSQVAEVFAKRLSLPQEEVNKIKYAALLHDIGKIDLPKKILNASKKLSHKERELVKNHTILAEKKLKKEYPELTDLIPLIKYHHEYWNGHGYPFNLKNQEIPQSAQIIAIVDNYNALLGRKYSSRMPIHEVCKILLNGAGSQWNPYLVFKFVKFIMSDSTAQST